MFTEKLGSSALIFFFFQAEDGIRDVAVTGFQTCALPICCAANPEPDFHVSPPSQEWPRRDPAMPIPPARRGRSKTPRTVRPVKTLRRCGEHATKTAPPTPTPTPTPPARPPPPRSHPTSPPPPP